MKLSFDDASALIIQHEHGLIQLSEADLAKLTEFVQHFINTEMSRQNWLLERLRKSEKDVK